MFRFSLLALLVAGISGSVSYAQDVANPVHTSFATIGRPPVPTWLGGRHKDAKLDWFDRYPCCGYGKTHDDMGVTGTRATCIQYWGGSCEFFAENCRRPTAQVEWRPAKKNASMYEAMFGKGQSGCSTCGK